MRTSKAALLTGLAGLLLAVAGCADEVSGTARPDPTPAPLTVSEDGMGIVAGFDEAPAHIEIFTEPQCTHCRDLQLDFGDQLAFHIAVGDLQVTYRPLTFLDEDDEGYSATVANAMFTAAAPAGPSGDSASSAVTGTEFQRFVEELWINQDPGGPSFSSDELYDMAMTAGMPDTVAGNLGDDRARVDIADMNDTNFVYLIDVDPVTAGTPTVYDLEGGQKIDIHDDDWLHELVHS
ncbi:MAG: thioredoxin domain-containing protein [Actinomycetota bacterium]|nr:thioredoxin domain-containing protein [Actinomycetota bacterium]